MLWQFLESDVAEFDGIRVSAESEMPLGAGSTWMGFAVDRLLTDLGHINIEDFVAVEFDDDVVAVDGHLFEVPVADGAEKSRA